MSATANIQAYLDLKEQIRLEVLADLKKEDRLKAEKPKKASTNTDLVNKYMAEAIQLNHKKFK